MCNDAHFLYTGYAKYGNEVLSRLAKTNKFELAELSCYGYVNDPRDNHVPWRYYANSIKEEADLQFPAYKSHPQNPFGNWRFERTCVDFRPDIVWDIRDPWMLAFEGTSTFRPFFHWAIMPTVDSAPQQEDWVSIFSGADSVATYSDYGMKTLQKTGSNIPLTSVASPGVDLDVFSPVTDKAAHRRKLGFFPNANIIGTIMRNQARKLYPDLFQAFRKFIDNCYDKGEKDLANNTYLYLHVSYPDLGWEIPSLLREHGLGRKVLFTYICKNCDSPFASFFKDARTVCRRCNHASAVLPSPDRGLTPSQLSEVINTFDAYIQYSVCEGFGMPQVEAAACGVPVMSVNYSAMEDVIKNTKGMPIPVERMFRDVGTHAYRALPDNDACAEIIYKFFKKPSAIRRVMGNKARKAAEKYYNWDATAKIWEDHFDSIELTNLQGKWSAPMLPCGKPPTMPDPKRMVSNSHYVDWLILNVLKEPKHLNSRFALKYLRQLNYGSRQSGVDMIPVTRKSVYDEMSAYAYNKLEYEMARTGQLELHNADFIEYAHQRDKYLK